MKTILRVICFLFFLAGLFAQTVQSYVNMGRRSLRDRDYYKAIEFYNSALRINDKYANAYLGLAEACFFLADYEEALYQLDQYDRFANAVDARVLRGRILAGLGKKDEAKKVLSVVLLEQPNNLDAQFGLAEVKLLEGNYNQAITDFERLLSRVADSRRALLSLLLLYEKVKRLDEAENVLRDVLFYNPQDPLTLYIVGEYYQRRRDWVKSLEYYNAVILIQKRFPAIDLRRAEAFLHLGEYRESERILEDLIKDGQRKNFVVWSMLAEVFVLQEKNQEAVHAYEEILRLDPNNQIARLSVENFVRRNFLETSDIRKRYAQERFLKGRNYQENFLYEKAYHEYRLALLISPNDVEIRYFYACLQKLMGNYHTYLHQLEVIKSMGTPTLKILDELEMEKYRPLKSVSKDWGVFYGQMGTPIRILIATVSAENQLPFGSGEHLQEFFHTCLDRYTRFEIINVGNVVNIDQAWNEARKHNTDFFVLMQYIDSKQDFYGGCDIYLTSTSALVSRYGVRRVNLDRIESVFISLGVQINGLIPMRAVLLNRRENLGLVSLGKVHGIKSDDQFIVLKSQGSYFKNRVPYYDYRKNHALGMMEVTRVDEFMSEGVFARQESSDVIKSGDEMYLVKDLSALTSGVLPLLGIPEGFLLIH